MRYTRAVESSILAEIASAITPACVTSARAARDAMARSAGGPPGNLEHLAGRLAGARHTAAIDVSRKHVIVCAADHGMALAGQVAGQYLPAALAAREIASGRAALNTVARTAGASVLVIDCGMAGSSPEHPGIIDLGLGAATGDIRQGPAMPRAVAEASIQTGIAFLLSLADTGTDCLALGQLAPGSHLAASALVAALGVPALAGTDVENAGDDTSRDRIDEKTLRKEGTPERPDEGTDVADVAAAFAANHIVISPERPASDPAAHAQVLDLLAALGGYEIGVMVGIILAAAALHIPVVLDEHGTSTAALLAHRVAPHAAGYVIASHRGQTSTHRRALAALGLDPLVEVGLAYGEGTGAALVLPLIDTTARVVRSNLD